MTSWQQILRDDPVEPLTADAAAAMRGRVAAAARRAATARQPLRLVPVFALGSALTAAVVAGVFVARAHPAVGPIPVAAEPAEVRQLQFATPGGTRIIWQFNPDFTMQGTHP